MKNSVIAALVSVAIMAGTALAGEMRDSYPKEQDVYPFNVQVYAPLKQGINQKGEMTIFYGSLAIIHGPGCSDQEGDLLSILASPDIHNQVSGKYVMIPERANSASSHIGKVDGSFDTGDANMIYVCFPADKDQVVWLDMIGYVLNKRP